MWSFVSMVQFIDVWKRFSTDMNKIPADLNQIIRDERNKYL